LFARRLAALTLALLGNACSQSDLGFSIPFTAVWDGVPIDCGSTSPALTDLRFFVSNLQLIDSSGEARDIRFATEMPWQNDAVALVDLEDGTGACLRGTRDIASEIIAVAPQRDYRGLRFTVGVPFRLNHLDPLTAKPPLDDSDMHWPSRSGYKFLRAGVRTENDGFWIHTGSAGCEGTIGHIMNCRFSNRVVVELADFIPGQSGVSFDLAALLAGTDLNNKLASDCSHGPPESSCIAPFAALGIDFSTGSENGRQQVFSTR
jgi:uncharacterized repeat protein (TIGR04052 family)